MSPGPLRISLTRISLIAVVAASCGRAQAPSPALCNSDSVQHVLADTLRGLVPPKVVRIPEMDAPFIGDVSYRVLVDKSGHPIPDSIHVIRASDARSDTLARANIIRWEFQAATLRGCAVTSWTEVGWHATFEIR